MKRLILSLACVLLLVAPLGAQAKHHRHHKPKPALLMSEPVTFQANSPGVTSTAILVEMTPGPTVEFVTSDNGKSYGLLRMRDAAGNLLVNIHMDGTMDLGENFQANETAKEFWKALVESFPKVCDANKQVRSINEIP